MRASICSISIQRTSFDEGDTGKVPLWVDESLDVVLAAFLGAIV
jgi:hypothetical protein